MRKKMLKLFWYWMNERHSIYLKRKSGEKYPWTKDKILQEYKFTNTFRQLDRVTQELAKRKKKYFNDKTDIGNIVFHVLVFRMFNWPESYDLLNEAGLLKKWNEKKAVKILTAYKEKGNKVFTGAYIITGGGLSNRGQSKVQFVCSSITKMWKDRNSIAEEMVSLNTLEESTMHLIDYPCVGKFISYEFITDLRHTKVLNKAKDIMLWANPGPGAKRGLNRLHGRELKFMQPDKKFIEEMCKLLSHSNLEMVNEKEMGEEGSLTLLVKDKRKLEMRDIEHSLCEFDKYCRVKNEEGRPRSRFSNEGK